jgi:hypothetical protein
MTKAKDHPSSNEEGGGLQLLMVALAFTVMFHGGLMPFTLGNTYDAYIHMFFGDHYHRQWFDPWEPRWYTGFATTSYPPGTHMAIGALMYIVPLRPAFVLVMLTGLILLCFGVYRFSLIWVRPRAAGYAAIAMALSSSVSETVHLFGQLPTIFSLGVFLNGLPFVYRWIVYGNLRFLLGAVLFSAATTAAHHVTTIFGGVLFILPLAGQALFAVTKIKPAAGLGLGRRLSRFLPALARGMLLAVLMIGAIATTVLAYWIWSINDPITQVPIPHGSRNNFLVDRDLGMIFFVIPWGLWILLLPYVVYKTATTRLWPLGLSVMLCFVVGTGGTTPFSRAILRGAFDILTLDRFTFWGSILILPFIGHLAESLLRHHAGEEVIAATNRYVHRILVGGLFLTISMLSVFTAIMPAIQPTQPKFVDPAPIVKFMQTDQHDRWRYLTLGMGDQFAYLSASMMAQSVDGNYHSARRLPDLTNFSVERLENAKYSGVAGLGSLRQFLENAEDYHLKYIFSNDAFYDPLLFFSGWNKLLRLGNGIEVWEKPDVSPLPLLTSRKETPLVLRVMWGTLPPIALLAAAVVFLFTILSPGLGMNVGAYAPLPANDVRHTHPYVTRFVVFAHIAFGLLYLSAIFVPIIQKTRHKLTAEETVVAYFQDLDFRRFAESYQRLDPVTRGTEEVVNFQLLWTGGLVASYGKLVGVDAKPLYSEGDSYIVWDVRLDWLTPLDTRADYRRIETVQRDGTWYLLPTSSAPYQAPISVQRQSDVAWNVLGRRQSRIETDRHRDRTDRPELGVSGARLVRRNTRYSLVGRLTNLDAEPGIVLMQGLMTGQRQILATKWAGPAFGGRLLPTESTGFRIDFEGVVSLKDAEALADYDPTIYIPPKLDGVPDDAKLETRAVVTGTDLYRGVSLNNLTIENTDTGPVLSALAVNTGTETATVVRLVVLLYDLQGAPIWVEAGYVPVNIYPGQGTPVSIQLPERSTIEIIADVEEDNVTVNGSNDPQLKRETPQVDTGVLPLEGIPGYSAMSVQISVMVYDPQD